MTTVLINPAPHGNGPYLVALKFARQLDKLKGEKSVKIVPYFSELQKKILQEHNFGDDVLLSFHLGNEIRKLNFSGQNYGQRLTSIIKNQKTVQEDVRKYLDQKLKTINLETSELEEIDPQDINYEISHNNIISTGFKSFLTTIVPFSKLIRHSYDEMQKGNLITSYKLEDEDSMDLQILGHKLERDAKLILTSTPSTLSYLDPQIYFNETLIPPFIQISDNQEDIKKGVFVIHSGIGGITTSKLENITQTFRKKGHEIYSVNPKEDETYAQETLISNPNIEYVVGRMGLSTVYLATQHSTPLITFPFQPEDDFEMWHNQQTFCNPEMPYVLLYNENESFLSKTEEVKNNIKKLNTSLEARFNTRAGLEYGANLIQSALA